MVLHNAGLELVHPFDKRLCRTVDLCFIFVDPTHSVATIAQLRGIIETPFNSSQLIDSDP
tara:strand:- start:753 stop:932 length:180 start_codon:yes stop_codon:yes gene_type:complete